ncbi:MAG: bifunctional 3-(3-hydroxy-phenyl)propionate/3-hydroxycinnamic acid hydroxylase [Cyanobacteria bacterium J06635_1]
MTSIPHLNSDILNCDVVIIGCGPVGAVAANLLGLYGIQTVVFERELDVYHLPRAIHFDHDIMRIFQQLGLYQKMSAVVTSTPELQFLDRHRRLLFSVREPASTTHLGFAQHYVFYQPWMESVLREGIARFDSVSVYLGHAVQSIVQESERVLVRGQDIDHQHEPVQVRARYVLGCDGAASLTRKSSGITLQDFKFDKQWLVVDTFLKDTCAPSVKRTLPKACQLLCDERRPTVSVPSVKNHHRWEFMLADHEQPAVFEQPAKVCELLSDWVDPDQLDIRRAVVYQFHSLFAQQWCKGNLFLLGDAAHQMPPFSGQGLCSGIRDAHNLCWKIHRVLKGYSSEDLLDTYAQERMPHVQEILQGTMRFGAIAQTQNPMIALARNTIFSLLHRIPAISRRLKNLHIPLPGLKTGILASTVDPSQSAAGQPFPQVEVSTQTGETILLDELMGHHFVILSFNLRLTARLSTSTQAAWKAQSTRFIHALSGPDSPSLNLTKTGSECLVPVEQWVVIDRHHQLSRWFAQQRGNIVIIRPDRYIFGVYNVHEIDSATAQVNTLLSVSS